MFILCNDLGNKLTLIGFLGYNISNPNRSADKSDDEARNAKKSHLWKRREYKAKTHSSYFMRR